MFLGQTGLLLHGLTFVGIVAGIAKSFEWADGGLSQESRFKLSLWLKSVPGPPQISAWACVFPNLIDRVFGKRAFSLKFFLRSCVASILAVGVTEALTVAMLGKSEFGSGENWIGYRTLVYYLWLAIPVNCIPDFFSLLFSRFIVRQMARCPTPIRVVALLILDSSVSLVIPIAAIGMVAPYLRVFGFLGAVDVYAHGFREEVSLFFATFASYARALTESWGWGPFLRLYLFASLFTSIWVWLYVTGSATIRVLHSVRALWVRVLPFLSVEDKPMQAIGRVAGVLGGLAYLAAFGGVWLLRHI